MGPYIISKHFKFDEPLPRDRAVCCALCLRDKKAFWDEDLKILREKLRRKGYSDLDYLITGYEPNLLILNAA